MNARSYLCTSLESIPAENPREMKTSDARIALRRALTPQNCAGSASARTMDGRASIRPSPGSSRKNTSALTGAGK